METFVACLGIETTRELEARGSGMMVFKKEWLQKTEAKGQI
jgi:hypothetical protein